MQITVQYEVMKLRHHTTLEVPETTSLSDLTSRIQALVGFGPISLFCQDALITDQNYLEFLRSKTVCIARIGA